MAKKVVNPAVTSVRTSVPFFQFEKLFHESLDSLIKNIVKIRIISEHSHVECNITILHEII